MKKNKTELMIALRQFGYPMLESDAKADPGELLVLLTESRDHRLLEGFPVVMANALEQEKKFDVNRIALKSKNRKLFEELVSFSLYLLKLYGLHPMALKRYGRWMKKDEFQMALDRRQWARLDRLKLDPERMRKTFLNYVVLHQRETGQREKEKEKQDQEFQKEYYLSLLLSPRQKELLYKRLRRERLTKTEREYFSRVVKKKLLALSDPELQQMAQKALLRE